MKELLERWAASNDTKLVRGEPTPRCHPFPARFNAGESIVIHEDNTVGDVVNPGIRSEYLYIQAATQEAIETRGWAWLIETTTTNPYTFYATVEDVEDDVPEPTNHQYATRNTAAEALLEAYLKMLEADHE